MTKIRSMRLQGTTVWDTKWQHRGLLIEIKLNLTYVVKDIKSKALGHGAKKVKNKYIVQVHASSAKSQKIKTPTLSRRMAHLAVIKLLLSSIVVHFQLERGVNSLVCKYCFKNTRIFFHDRILKLSPLKEKWEKQIEELFSKGFYAASKSQFGAPLLLMKRNNY